MNKTQTNSDFTHDIFHIQYIDSTTKHRYTSILKYNLIYSEIFLIFPQKG